MFRISFIKTILLLLIMVGVEGYTPAAHPGILQDTVQEVETDLKAQFKLEHQRAINLENELELDHTRDMLSARTVWLWVSVVGLFISIVIGGLVITNFRRNKQLQEHQVQQKLAKQEMMLLKERQAGEENERARISRELHDNIGGLLVAAKMHLGMAIHNPQMKEENRTSLEKVVDIISKAHQEARTVSHQLSPGKLEEKGLKKALSYYCQLISQDELPVHFECYGNIDDVKDQLAVVIYRAVQELVANAIKHAECSCIKVAASRNGGDCIVIVEDDGKGYSQSGDADTNGIGLQSIRSQLKVMKGLFKIRRTDEEGTKVTIILPMIPS